MNTVFIYEQYVNVHMAAGPMKVGPTWLVGAGVDKEDLQVRFVSNQATDLQILLMKKWKIKQEESAKPNFEQKCGVQIWMPSTKLASELQTVRISGDASVFKKDKTTTLEAELRRETGGDLVLTMNQIRTDVLKWLHDDCWCSIQDVRAYAFLHPGGAKTVTLAVQHKWKPLFGKELSDADWGKVTQNYEEQKQNAVRVTTTVSLRPPKLELSVAPPGKETFPYLIKKYWEHAEESDEESDGFAGVGFTVDYVFEVRFFLPQSETKNYAALKTPLLKSNVMSVNDGESVGDGLTITFEKPRRNSTAPKSDLESLVATLHDRRYERDPWPHFDLYHVSTSNPMRVGTEHRWVQTIKLEAVMECSAPVPQDLPGEAPAQRVFENTEKFWPFQKIEELFDIQKKRLIGEHSGKFTLPFPKGAALDQLLLKAREAAPGAPQSVRVAPVAPGAPESESVQVHFYLAPEKGSAKTRDKVHRGKTAMLLETTAEVHLDLQKNTAELKFDDGDPLVELGREGLCLHGRNVQGKEGLRYTILEGPVIKTFLEGPVRNALIIEVKLPDYLTVEEKLPGRSRAKVNPRRCPERPLSLTCKDLLLFELRECILNFLDVSLLKRAYDTDPGADRNGLPVPAETMPPFGYDYERNLIGRIWDQTLELDPETLGRNLMDWAWLLLKYADRWWVIAHARTRLQNALDAFVAYLEYESQDCIIMGRSPPDIKRFLPQAKIVHRELRKRLREKTKAPTRQKTLYDIDRDTPPLEPEPPSPGRHPPPRSPPTSSN